MKKNILTSFNVLKILGEQSESDFFPKKIMMSTNFFNNKAIEDFELKKRYNNE